MIKEIYGAAIIVQHPRRPAQLIASIVIAVSEAEALGFAIEKGRSMCPSSEGWGEPAAQITEALSESIIMDVLRSK